MEQTLLINGQRWFTKVVGGHGPAILWLHGFTGSHASWSSIVPYFSHQFQCVTVDILGHGQSDKPTNVRPYSMESLVDSLQTLMKMQGHELFRVVGYSMGGRIALSLAVKHPTNIVRLVLESASPGVEGEVERADRQKSDENLANWIEEHGVDSFVERWEHNPIFASQARCDVRALENQRKIRRNQQPQGLAGSLRGTGTGAQPPLWSALADLRVPVLLLTGEEDIKFTTLNRKMALSLPNAIHRVLSQAGHTVHMEQPEQYTRYVQSFFTGNGDRN